MTEKEAKFHRDVNDLVIRAFRAGATTASVKLVLEVVAREVSLAEPYIRAIAEKDLAP